MWLSGHERVTQGHSSLDEWLSAAVFWWIRVNAVGVHAGLDVVFIMWGGVCRGDVWCWSCGGGGRGWQVVAGQRGLIDEKKCSGQEYFLPTKMRIGYDFSI